MTDRRKILSLSGGKDSTALAVLMRDTHPDLEYVFCDTGNELPETYEYLARLEAYLGKPITVLTYEGGTFEDLLAGRRNFLPSPQVRWCTEYLKIKPFEKYIGNDPCINYIGIRADENRKGYISSKPNIIAEYPFIDLGITKSDVISILNDSGLGMPPYSSWRSRSGCYFCFFQQRIEWVGLLENHEDLFYKAASYEREDPVTRERYTWNQRESLLELARPERIQQIKEEHDKRVEYWATKHKKNRTLAEVLSEEEEAEAVRPCVICSI